MTTEGTTDKTELYERPFKPEEHGFNNGNVYILKAALRRRLNEIDSKWRTSDPEIMATVGDVVLMRGCLILQGASRTAVGTGIIITTKKIEDAKTKAVSYEPLPSFELARNLAKAYKTAASDLLPRLCIEYNIGAYLKAVPKNIRDVAGLTTWLNSLKPAPLKQTQTVTPPVTTTTQPAPKMASCLAVDEQCKKQFAALRDELRITGDKPYLERLSITKYSDYTGTLDELFAAMRNLHAKFLLEGDHNRIGADKPAEPEITEAGAAALAAGEVTPGASPFDVSAPQVNPHTGEVETPRNGSKFARGLNTYQQQQEQQQAQSVNDDIDAALTRAMELSE